MKECVCKRSPNPSPRSPMPTLSHAHAHVRCMRRQWVTHVAVDDYVTFKISGSGGQILCCRVRGVERYSTFMKMLTCLGTDKVLPGAALDPARGAALYHTYCNRQGISYAELEKTCGVVAIALEVLGD